MTAPETATCSSERSSVAPARILVIDDEAPVRQVLGSTLKAHGYIVEAAPSGRAAVDCLRNQHFDVALTDLVMPEMDGIQTMAALKDLDADIEVIILTGYAGVDSASAALKQGACDYLQKPISAQELHTAVVRAIEIRRLNTALWPSDAASAMTESMSPRDPTMSQFRKRKRAEEELRWTQFAVENASDAVFWLDPEARIVYANAAACRSLGRSREELLSLSIPDIHPRFSERGWSAIWKEMKDRGSVNIETEHQAKDGRSLPRGSQRQADQIRRQRIRFAFARDITERKRAERCQQSFR